MLGIGRALKKAGKKINKLVKDVKNNPVGYLAPGAQVALNEVGGVLAPDINMPDAEQGPVAPVADDETARALASRELQRRYAGRGRAGTVLTGVSGLG